MFDLDKWQEIINTIQKNKLRTFLTGFSVAWGIFILVILMGSGKGFENGVRDQFGSDAMNAIWIWNGQTSMDFGGMLAGRRTQFTNKDYEETKSLNAEGIEHISGRFNLWTDPTVTYKNEYCTPSIINVHTDNKFIDLSKIIEGRQIDDLDIKQRSKVTTIDTVVRDALFKNKKEVIGSYINVNGIPFKVVGVFKSLSQYDNKKIYLPITTGQIVYNKTNTIDGMALTTKEISLQESQKLVENLRVQFAKRHKFNKDDHSAININNNIEGYMQVMTLFRGIRIFIWIIGIGTIISGIVGVSNIMIIVVKDRTKEIGVRKAIGATPGSVVGLILFESILITSLAGYIGLMMGVGLLELIRPYFTNSQNFFMNPEADIKIAINATLLLVISGAIAGLFPSMRAARIRPIDALRDE